MERGRTATGGIAVIGGILNKKEIVKIVYWEDPFCFSKNSQDFFGSSKNSDGTFFAPGGTVPHYATALLDQSL